MRVGWQRSKLVDVTSKIGSGATPRGGKKSYKEVGIPLIRSLNVHDGYFKKKDLAFLDDDQAEKLSNVIVENGDVLLNITGASIARCCVAPTKCLPARVNQHVAIIRPKALLVDTQFLAYLLVSREHKDSLLNAGDKAGATRQALTKAQLQNYEIDFPSLPVQKRIVAILDKAFEGIAAAAANAEKNLANARELFESCLSNAFVCRGSRWSRTRLSELINITHGFAFKGSDFKVSQDDSKPIVLTPGNYTADGTLYFSSKNTKRFFGQATPGYLFKIGDLTVVMTDLSSKMKILGKPAFIARLNVLHNQRIGRVVFKSKNIAPRLVYYFLRTRMASEKIKETSTGTMVRHTAPKRILGLEINYPIKHEDQFDLVSFLDDFERQVQSLEDICQRKLAMLTELKQSLLQKAFSGVLTAGDADLKEESAA
ncbi:MAG: hypothetical protein DIZ78_12235 [endosymbiont of Escarpia spicata]|uniref:Type I restriction modification DNA specificity domain-containing protein n=1 Tax=endosymbiont of Escarpia spicata TaxID=2200908 RepID=A0A370DHA9_9GAMM|nr:MAG: hypothetical protein DIZ78_12235 [endosymbiont of Escarpia spicata]